MVDMNADIPNFRTNPLSRIKLYMAMIPKLKVAFTYEE